ncbi:hypothetical protein NEMBOFW57_009139 [Staphylotrichum longicolle]|uniref:Heterokaryon incompatibility domain-containing protein n=1 Tax=Staphylotrichum longicolle TaxID=669026 RepID=A0AAD4EWD9_9PEZI|nr:hypothetical protein NEMBOFW57_009139 [Staphylotrichum longicolle]
MTTRGPLYRPISSSEFRVVHLLPGAFSDPIRCVLETRPSSLKIRYEALSYQWGDETTTKPISIARLDPPTPSLTIRPSPTNPAPSKWPTTALTALQASVTTTYAQYRQPLQILTFLVGTALIYTTLEFLPFDPPDWVPRLIPRRLYLFALSLLIGGAPADVLARGGQLVREVNRTKPWALLASPDRRLAALALALPSAASAGDGDGDAGRGKGEEGPWYELQVTVNLALALRYLRLDKTVRTVWVDALCINQGDAAEKDEQVQRMDLVYANASGVVVWLGAYHGIAGARSQGCEQEEEEGGECEHRAQIRDAFRLIWLVSGWRVLAGFYLGKEKKEMLQKARPGMRDMFKRGWWERLWVVQEVALATGPIRIQCGHYTCTFDNFRSALYTILGDASGKAELTREAAPVKRLSRVVKDFQYSAFHDRESETTRMVSKGLAKLTGFLFREGIPEARFHELSFAGRLQRILLRTAGHFQCRDDQDRLYAVLGIAGGATAGNTTQLADVVRYLSSFSTCTVIAKCMDPYFKAYPDSLKLKIAGYAIGFAQSSWANYYDIRARHWTINRPEYAVTRHREVMEAVAGAPGADPGRGRVAFFTALARYLATETETLSFLEAASCGEDKDEGMPSWVPNWTRAVSSEACDFASRERKDLAKDSFGFNEDGKTMWLVGRPRGRVHVVRSERDTASPTEQLLEHWLALPAEGKEGIQIVLNLLAAIMREMPDSELDEAGVEALSHCFKLIQGLLGLGRLFLQKQKETLVYSYDKTAGDMGFLKAGEAARGDYMVFVPGCFHHLVLRSLGRDNRWKLVGLVAMGTDRTKQAGCPASEWDKLLEERAVFRYTLV